MFNLRNFVMKTIRKMVGNEPDYKVMQYCLNWYDREVLVDEDLLEVQQLIDDQYKDIEETTDDVLEDDEEELDIE